MYIARVYDTFPKLFEFLEKFLIGTMFTAYSFFCIMAIIETTGTLSADEFDWTFHFVYPILISVLLIFFSNSGITSIVCSKDYRAIRSEGARFDESYEFPTIASDIQAISSLFHGNQSQTVASEDAKIEALQKYKALLDQGVITKQEYEAKKAELLEHPTNKT